MASPATLANPIQLRLLVGPVIPLPAPREVVEALEDVTVTSASGQRGVFQMRFRLSTRSPLQTMFLAAGGSLPPIVRVVLVAVVGGVSEVLIDGVMTDHEVDHASGGGDAMLTITGEDLGRLMDWIDFSGIPYPAMPPEARVMLILAKYAPLGVVPMVIPTVLVDVPIPLERIPAHRGKDLDYVRGLAEDVGYIFHLEPGPEPGMSVAYWGPEIKLGIPQPALTLDIDLHRNVESLTCSVDTQKRTLPVLYIHNALTKVPIPIPVPDVGLLNPPLGLVPPSITGIEPLAGTAKRSPLNAALFGLGHAARDAEAVTVTGTLDVRRYGHVLKPRRLVGVRGAGTAWDGLYYCKRVKHSIKRGEFKQEFTLTRNGLMSTVSNVAV